MESTTFYRIQIDQPNVFLFISENGSYKSGSKRVTVQLRTAVSYLLAFIEEVIECSGNKFRIDIH